MREDHNVTDLPAWLMRQIDTDERVAKAAASDAASEYLTCFSPARMLVECEAKRRIIWTYISADGALVSSISSSRALARSVLGRLALPYADREGYRDEWRP